MSKSVISNNGSILIKDISLQLHHSLLTASSFMPTTTVVLIYHYVTYNQQDMNKTTVPGRDIHVTIAIHSCTLIYCASLACGIPFTYGYTVQLSHKVTRACESHASHSRVTRESLASCMRVACEFHSSHSQVARELLAVNYPFICAII